MIAGYRERPTVREYSCDNPIAALPAEAEDVADNDVEVAGQRFSQNSAGAEGSRPHCRGWNGQTLRSLVHRPAFHLPQNKYHAKCNRQFVYLALQQVAN